MPEREVNTFCSPHCGETPCEFVVTVRDGRAVSLKPHPKLKYSPCPKGFTNIQRLYHPDRLKYPMERTGKRGEGKWRRISWDDALEKIASRLNYVKSKYGNESVVLYNYVAQLGRPDSGPGTGNRYSILRLLNLWGGCIPAYQRGSLCWQALIAASNNLYGTWKATLPADSECRTIIVWGTNPAETASRGVMRSFRQAKKRGTRFIVIDPVFTDTARLLADTYLPIRPGTDLALALSMMNVIIGEGLFDLSMLLEHTNAPYLVRCDNGKLLRWRDVDGGSSDDYVVWDSEANSPRPRGDRPSVPALSGTYTANGIQSQPVWHLIENYASEWTLQRAEETTGIPAEQIRETARALAINKPAKIAFYFSPGLQRASWGENTVYAMGSLNVITGNFSGTYAQMYHRLPTMDIGFDESALRYVVANPVKKRIPVNHLAEAILNPARYDTNIKALLVMWGNPVGQNANSNKTIEALKNESLELIVVCDIFITATAQYADILLPVSTFLERTSIMESSETNLLAYPNLLDLSPKPQLFFREKTVEPLGESKDDFEIICLLAEKLGHGEHFPWKNTENWIADVLDIARKDPRFPWLKTVTMERLKQEGVIDIDAPLPKPTWELQTPSGMVELYSEALLEMGYDPIPIYREPEEGPVSTPDLYRKYPLNLISPHSRWRAHSSFANQPEILQSHPPEVLIHTDDAEERGIVNGELVRIFNDRGTFEIKAKVSEGIRPGVVRIYEGGWPEHGMVNLLTSDRLTTYGENPTYNTCLVQVTRAASSKKSDIE
ncbi:molybdopterin-dependent oxidoreductase [Chloroflexota bacterium]